MTSGVRYNEDYEALDSDIAVTDVASGWRTAQQGVPIFAVSYTHLTLPTNREV